MRVLVYVRKWNEDFYVKLVKQAFDSPEIDVYSDFRGQGDIWGGQYIYDPAYDGQNESFEANKEDIITRCRFLRSLPRAKAEELSGRFWNGMEERFLTRQYDVVVSAIIDCYTMDVIERMAEKMQCQYFSLVTFFVRGYSRFTRRGERYDAQRPVSEEEVRKVLDMLSEDSYTVNYTANQQKKPGETRKFFLRRRLIERVAFPILKFKEKDPWNYHYNSLSFTEGPYRQYDVKRAQKHYKKIDEAALEGDEVYLPLHYAPEATVDYWCGQAGLALYEKSVLDFISRSDPRVKFVVKEHPAMYGKRAISFYEKLCGRENVVIIHPYENSNRLMKKIHNVLVYTGSVGVEALLRGKRVFTVTENYYSDTSANMVQVSKLEKEDLALEDVKNDNVGMMRKILSGVFAANSSAGRDIDKSDLDEIAQEMRRIYLANAGKD